MTTCNIDGCEKPSRKRSWCTMHYKRWQRHGDPEWKRPARACGIEGCGRRIYGRGWCNMHYQRWRNHGDPLAINTYADPEEAFLARAEPIVGDPGCIVWLGSLGTGGYGTVWVDGSHVAAHRYAWERENGPIPDGMFIDHACHERSCVNVDHLRLATPKQNAWNLRGANRASKTGIRGVHRQGNSYIATVRAHGVSHYLGSFSTPEEASAAATSKRKSLFGEYAGRA